MPSKRSNQALIFALLALVSLGFSIRPPTARAFVVPPVDSPIFIQTNGPDASIALGDWYTSRNNGTGPGYHYFGIYVPCAWPDGLEFHVDLFSPEINSAVPGFDEPGGPPIDATTFELYTSGTQVVAPALPGPGGPGSLISATFAPSNVAPNRWVRFYSLAPPVACGQYILRAQTGGNDQNSWRLRFGSDNDSDPNNEPPANYDNPDGLLGSGDEAVVGIAHTTYQHFATTGNCLTLYQFVATGLSFARFHNFDMDQNERVVYYPPSATYDPTGLNGQGIGGTTSGFTVWNNGTQTTRGGDVINNPEPGWWRIVSCVLGGNQFNQEGQVGVPTFYQPIPTPDLVINKDDGQTEADPGGVLTYTIAFTNTALTSQPVPGAALNVVITDTLASETTFVSCGFVQLPTRSGSCAHKAGQVIWRLDGPLVAGASGVLSVTVQVDPDAIGPLRNLALIDFRDIIGNQYPPVSDDDVNVVRELPALRSTKSDRLLVDRDLDGQADPLDIIEYTLAVINEGRLAAAPVTISDTPDPLTRLIAGTVSMSSTSLLSATVIQGNRPGDSVVAVEIARLDPGAQVVVIFQTEVRSDIPSDATVIVNQARITTPGLPPQLTDDPTNPGGPTETTVDPPQVSPPLAINLVSFTARTTAAGIELSWTTGAEFDSAGFHLYRSLDAERSSAVQVTMQRIPAQGGPGSGSSYGWLDKSANPGSRYFYWLVEYDRVGGRSEYGPAHATLPSLTALHTIYLPMLLR